MSKMNFHPETGLWYLITPCLVFKNKGQIGGKSLSCIMLMKQERGSSYILTLQSEDDRLSHLSYNLLSDDVIGQ